MYVYPYFGNLVFSKIVTVEQVDIDRYGRTVGNVYLDKHNINWAYANPTLQWEWRKKNGLNR